MRTLSRQLLAVIRLTHLFAVLVVALVSAVFAWLALGGSPISSPICRVFAAMFALQVAIGCTNEIADRDLDAQGKPWRPLPSGTISVELAVGLAIIAGVVGLGISWSLGATSLTLAAIGLFLGVSYDLWLKRGQLAWFPFVLAVPLVPIWSYASVGEPTARLWLLYPLGFLPIVAVHLANILPDVESDARAGVGLAQRWGRGRVLTLCVAALVFAPGPILMATPIAPLLPVVFAPALAAYAALVIAGLIMTARARGGDRWLFHFCAPAVAILGVGWVAGAGA